MPTIALISLISITLYQLIKFLRDKIEELDGFIKRYFGRIDFLMWLPTPSWSAFQFPGVHFSSLV